MNDFLVEVKIKERASGHWVKADSFQGSPEEIIELLWVKYSSPNKKPYERLGEAFFQAIQK